MHRSENKILGRLPASGLADRGTFGTLLGEGDTVAICMENNRAYLEAAWAAQRSGLRYTALDRPSSSRSAYGRGPGLHSDRDLATVEAGDQGKGAVDKVVLGSAFWRIT